MDIMGLRIINEMTREQLITELLAHQRRVLEKQDNATLKGHVVEFRVSEYRDRAIKEAGIVVDQSMFHTRVIDEDDQ